MAAQSYPGEAEWWCSSQDDAVEVKTRNET
jgi:hypothetical protein